MASRVVSHQHTTTNNVKAETESGGSKIRRLLQDLSELAGEWDRHEAELDALRRENERLRGPLKMSKDAKAGSNCVGDELHCQHQLPPNCVSDDCEVTSIDGDEKAPLKVVGVKSSIKAESNLSFSIREMWVRDDKRNMSLVVSDKNGYYGNKSLTNTSDDLDVLDPDETDYDGKFKHVISFPGSTPRMIWDLLGGMLILYDMIVIPMVVFEPPAHWFTTTMDWLTLVFWTLNVGATVTVGYVANGVTVMNPEKIVVNYLKSWFLIDMVCILPDWYFSIDYAVRAPSSTNVDGGNSTKMLRILRLSRCVRLLRLAKLKQVMQSIQDLFDSEYLSIILNIVKMIVVLLSINHIIACLWFLMTQLASNSEVTWVKFHDFEHDVWDHKYLVAFHWSITQFTPASMHVQPQNKSERIFAVSVVVFALVGFSYIVGAISTSLAKIRGMQEDTAQQFWLLRKYLRQKKVPRTLGLRIQRYLEHAWSAQKSNINIKNARIFALLSEQLVSELECATLKPLLAVHPLLEHLFEVAPATMRRVCNVVVSRKALAFSDDLFFPGEAALNMYFVASGKLNYSKATSPTDVSLEDGEEVKEGDWIAEPVLWTASWAHLGLLRALRECELIKVEPSKFLEVICITPLVLKIVSSYAQQYMEWLNSTISMELSDILKSSSAADLISSSKVEEGTTANAGRLTPSLMSRIPGSS
eukprot:TRINITY_DN7629_c0_g1_i1.p1 TRINITY_DN7629_c0_g1~~TRINITY_DN7629_c0_g1_i1.p1  ORF type:complete len:699 (-),score=87.43 TRINITY_DN7629_c0_g1_i1:194-2290(-)